MFDKKKSFDILRETGVDSLALWIPRAGFLGLLVLDKEMQTQFEAQNINILFLMYLLLLYIDALEKSNIWAVTLGCFTGLLERIAWWFHFQWKKYLSKWINLCLWPDNAISIQERPLSLQNCVTWAFAGFYSASHWTSLGSSKVGEEMLSGRGRASINEGRESHLQCLSTVGHPPALQSCPMAPAGKPKVPMETKAPVL